MVIGGLGVGGCTELVIGGLGVASCKGWAALGQGLLVGCTEAKAGPIVQRLGCTRTGAVGDCC